MKVNGSKIRCQVMELIIMQMELFIEVTGKTIDTMDQDSISFQTQQYMKVNGKTIYYMEQDFLLIVAVKSGQESLEMESLIVVNKSN